MTHRGPFQPLTFCDSVVQDGLHHSCKFSAKLERRAASGWKSRMLACRSSFSDSHGAAQPLSQHQLSGSGCCTPPNSRFFGCLHPTKPWRPFREDYAWERKALDFNDR